jgi:CheY-like chemotaxis protein
MAAARGWSQRMQTILVIDDDESLRDTIGVLLEQEGFRAVLIENGRDGFEKALLLKPDLVLVDLRLPGMSGVDICKQLRAARADPIIVPVRRAMKDSAAARDRRDDYVVKPFGAASCWRASVPPPRQPPHAVKGSGIDWFRSRRNGRSKV